MDHEQLWTTIEKHRLALADLLEGLSPDHWDQPSLCREWRVRDVAAHVTMSTRVRPFHALKGVVLAGGNFNRYVAQEARARSDRPTAELVSDLRSAAGSRRHPPGTKPQDPLCDVLVHTLDIARPLGIEHEVPPDAGLIAADRFWSMGFPFHARRRAAGVRLRATDAAWERGDPSAPEAAGRLADILLVLAGRPAGAERLEGAGVGAIRF